MHSHAATMSDADMKISRRFFAGEARVERKPGVTAGAAPKAAQVCVACTRRRRRCRASDLPDAGRQHADYLERALHEYREGSRKDLSCDIPRDS